MTTVFGGRGGFTASLVLFALVVFATAFASQLTAQEGYFRAQQPSGITPLTGATVLWASNPALGGSQSSAVPQQVSLPFPFRFYGELKTSIWVVHRGWMQFAATAPTYTGSNRDALNTNEPNRITSFWDEYVFYPLGDPTFPITLLPQGPRTVISHKAGGTAPNRTWTIEFLNLVKPISASSAVEISCQTVLYENGSVEFKYPTGPYTPISGLDASAGLTGVQSQGGVTVPDQNGNVDFVPVFNYLCSPIRAFGYYEPFEPEAGVNFGWSVPSGTGTQWQWGQPTGGGTSPLGGANGSTSAWRTNSGAAGYSTGSTTVLESPRMRKDGPVATVLNFWMNMSSESGVSGGRLEIARNNGTFITVLPTDAGWLMGAPNSSSVSALGSGGWSGTFPATTGAYQQVKLNLFTMSTPGLSGGWGSVQYVQFRFRFASGATSGSLSGWTIDEFRLGADVVNDVGPVALVTPTSKTGNTGAEAVSVKIRNHGGLLVTSVPVGVTMTGPTGTVPQALSGVWTGALLPNQEVTYSLPGSVNLSRAGEYAVVITTSMAGDAVSANNVNTTVVQSISVVSTLPYYASFDGGNPENVRFITSPGLYPSATVPGLVGPLQATTLAGEVSNTRSITTESSRNGDGAIYFDCAVGQSSQIDVAAAMDFYFDLSAYTPQSHRLILSWSRRYRGSWGSSPTVGIFASIDGGTTWALCLYHLTQLSGSVDRYWADERVDVSKLFANASMSFGPTVAIRFQLVSGYLDGVVDDVRLEQSGIGLRVNEPWPENDGQETLSSVGGTLAALELHNSGIAVTSVTAVGVELRGTVAPSDIASLRLIEDLDRSRTLTPFDPILSTLTIQGTTATGFVSNFSFTTNEFRRVLLVVSLGSGAVGHSIGLTITSTSFTSSPIIPMVGGFPLVSRLFHVPPVLRAPYSTSFETSMVALEGWGMEGQSGSVWERGAPVAFTTANGPGPTAAKSGSRVFGTKLNGPPKIGQSRRDLVTPTFSLLGMVNPVVSFWLWIDGTGMTFQTSKNDGVWDAPASNDPAWLLNAPYTSVSWNSQGSPGWQGGFSQSGTWVQISMRLFAVITAPSINGITSNDSVRFKFSWRVENDPGDNPGVFIDDFQISEFGGGAAVLPPPPWSPTVVVSVGGVTVPDGGSATVPAGSTVASKSISIAVSGTTATSLQGFVSGAGNGNGILSTEWSRNTPANAYQINPVSGVFNAGGYSHQVLLKIYNGGNFIERRLSIVIGPPSILSAALSALSAEPNDQISVPLNLAWLGGEPVAELMTEIRYNSGIIRFSSAALDGAQSSFLRMRVSDTGERVSLFIHQGITSSLIAPGNVVNLNFRVLPTAIAGTFPIEVVQLSMRHPAGMVTHSLTSSTVASAAGSVSVSIVPPTISVLWEQFPVANGGLITVPYRSTLASIGLSLRGLGRPNESLTLTTVMPTTASTAMLVAAEFNGSGTQSLTNLPSTGQFLTPGANYTFVLSLSSPASTVTKTFTIVVGPNFAPSVAARIGVASIANGSSSVVPIGTTMSSLGLVVTASDPDGDPVAMTGQVSNVSLQGFVNSQFTANGTPATVSPVSGVFSLPGASHTFTLSASDGIGGSSTFSFTIAVRGNTAPSIQVTRNGIPVASDVAVTVPYFSRVSELDLAIRLVDVDEDSVSLALGASGVLPVGHNPAEYVASSVSSGTVLRPVSGSFRQSNGIASIIMTASDPYGANSQFILKFSTGPNAPPMLRATVGGEVVSPNQVVNVAYGSLLGALGLEIEIDDLAGTTATLATTISALQPSEGINLAEWTQSARTVPFSRGPLSGRFAVPNVDHVVTLTANDGDGGVTTLNFTLSVGANTEPQLVVTSQGEQSVAAYGVSPGASLAALGLAATAVDPDPFDQIMLQVSLTGAAISGYPTTPQGASSLSGLASLVLPGGQFTTDNAQHTLTFTATDSAGASTIRVVTVFVASTVRLATVSLPEATVGQSYSATLSAVLGTTPYVYSATGLPTWLSLNATTGVMSGTPPRGVGTEPVSIAVTVTDADPVEPRTSSRTLSLIIRPAAPVDVVMLQPESLTTPTSEATVLDSSQGTVRNVVVPVDLPFPVTFYGSSHSRVWVSTNGWVSFTDPNGNSHPSNSRVDSPAGPSNAVFLFWDQLELPAGSGANITVGSAPATNISQGPVTNAGAGCVVIGFENLAVVGRAGTSLSGQIVFDADSGTAQVEYPTTGQNWSGATATVGIRGPYPDQAADPFALGAMAVSPPVVGVAFSVPDVVTLISATVPSATQYAAYSATLIAHGGTPPYVWSIAGAPAWLSVDAATGLLSGTPHEASGPGVDSFVVSVAAADGSSESRPMTVAVAAGVAPPAPVIYDSGSQCSLVSGGARSNQALLWLLLPMLAIALVAAYRRQRLGA